MNKIRDLTQNMHAPANFDTLYKAPTPIKKPVFFLFEKKKITILAAYFSAVSLIRRTARFLQK